MPDADRWILATQSCPSSLFILAFSDPPASLAPGSPLPKEPGSFRILCRAHRCQSAPLSFNWTPPSPGSHSGSCTPEGRWLLSQARGAGQGTLLGTGFPMASLVSAYLPHLSYVQGGGAGGHTSPLSLLPPLAHDAPGQRGTCSQDPSTVTSQLPLLFPDHRPGLALDVLVRA